MPWYHRQSSMSDENLFNQYLDPSEEIPKIINMLREKKISEHTARTNAIGNTIDKLREKLAQSEQLGRCLWCGRDGELICLYGHVLVETSLLITSALREAFPRSHVDR